MKSLIMKKKFVMLIYKALHYGFMNDLAKKMQYISTYSTLWSLLSSYKESVSITMIIRLCCVYMYSADGCSNTFHDNGIELWTFLSAKIRKRSASLIYTQWIGKKIFPDEILAAAVLKLMTQINQKLFSL